MSTAVNLLTRVFVFVFTKKASLFLFLYHHHPLDYYLLCDLKTEIETQP